METKKKRNNRKKMVGYNTDRVAKLVYNSLRQDFQTILPFIEHRSPVFSRDCGSYRDFEWPEPFMLLEKPNKAARQMMVSRFAVDYQLRSIFKKYRFQNEKLNPSALKEKTYQKYVDFQADRSDYSNGNYAKAMLTEWRTHLVLQRARRIIKKILGEFSWNEVFEACRFGRNSSVGCTFADAYLDFKLSEPEAFTGTIRSITLFAKYLKTDTLLGRVLKDRVPVIHDVLPLVQVPKKHDINRTITPLTLISLWLSYGLGVVIEERLRLHHIDIRRLQQKHAEWIKEYSNDLSHATLDLSFGSENIVSSHLNRSLPRAWFNGLKETFSHQLIHDDTRLYAESVMPMGNGATFPVETLFFYGVIRAICSLTRLRGKCSVYGDDIIVPVKAMPYVETVFSDLKLKLNRSKSFSSLHFRESCGADFYYGANVRPFFMPEGMKYQHPQSTRYIMWLHKCINGLTRRWDPTQIRLTLRALLIELAVACRGKIYCIPPSFPDTAGVKISCPDQPLTSDPFEWVLPKVDTSLNTRNYLFSYYIETPDKRAVISSACYLWDCMRTAVFQDRFGAPINWKDDFGTLNYVDSLQYFSESTDVLTYRRAEKLVQYRNAKGILIRKKKVKWVPECADRNVRSVQLTQRGKPRLISRLKDGKLTIPGGEGDPIVSDWI